MELVDYNEAMLGGEAAKPKLHAEEELPRKKRATVAETPLLRQQKQKP